MFAATPIRLYVDGPCGRSKLVLTASRVGSGGPSTFWVTGPAVSLCPSLKPVDHGTSLTCAPGWCHTADCGNRVRLLLSLRYGNDLDQIVEVTILDCRYETLPLIRRIVYGGVVSTL